MAQIDFYAKFDLPDAQRRVIEDESVIIPALTNLLKSLDPELGDADAEKAVKELITIEEFLRIYYFLKTTTPGFALYYFILQLNYSMNVRELATRLVSLIYPGKDKPTLLLAPPLSVSKSEFNVLMESIWQILAPALIPVEPMTGTSIQRDILEYYGQMRSWITSTKDYIESELADLDSLVSSYMMNEITLMDFITRIPELSIRTNKYAEMFFIHVMEATNYGQSDPKDVLAYEVERINEKITIDIAFKAYFLDGKMSIQTALDFLRLFEQKAVRIDNISQSRLSQIFTDLEFQIRNGVFSNETPSIEYFNTAFDYLLAAARRLEHLPGIVEFINFIKTARKAWEYDISVITDETPDSMKGAIIFILLSRTSVRFVYIEAIDDSYRGLINGARESVEEILTLARPINDEIIRVRIAARIISMLTYSEIHHDTLETFIEENLEQFVKGNVILLVQLLPYMALQNHLVKTWIAQHLEH